MTNPTKINAHIDPQFNYTPQHILRAGIQELGGSRGFAALLALYHDCTHTYTIQSWVRQGSIPFRHLDVVKRIVERFRHRMSMPEEFLKLVEKRKPPKIPAVLPNRHLNAWVNSHGGPYALAKMIREAQFKAGVVTDKSPSRVYGWMRAGKIPENSALREALVMLFNCPKNAMDMGAVDADQAPDAWEVAEAAMEEQDEKKRKQLEEPKKDGRSRSGGVRSPTGFKKKQPPAIDPIGE